MGSFLGSKKGFALACRCGLAYLSRAARTGQAGSGSGLAESLRAKMAIRGLRKFPGFAGTAEVGVRMNGVRTELLDWSARVAGFLPGEAFSPKKPALVLPSERFAGASLE